MMNKPPAFLVRAFHQPSGLPGSIVGRVMARTNRGIAAWVVELLNLRPADRVLEVGFGPGVGIELLAAVLPEGEVSGIDCSELMYRQAILRNRKILDQGRADLRLAWVEHLPFPAGVFDSAMPINSLQAWPEPLPGLREVRRVLRPGGRAGLGFNHHSRQDPDVFDLVERAGFQDVSVRRRGEEFCILATSGR